MRRARCISANRAIRRGLAGAQAGACKPSRDPRHPPPGPPLSSRPQGGTRYPTYLRARGGIIFNPSSRTRASARALRWPPTAGAGIEGRITGHSVTDRRSPSTSHQRRFGTAARRRVWILQGAAPTRAAAKSRTRRDPRGGRFGGAAGSGRSGWCGIHRARRLGPAGRGAAAPRHRGAGRYQHPSAHRRSYRDAVSVARQGGQVGAAPGVMGWPVAARAVRRSVFRWRRRAASAARPPCFRIRFSIASGASSVAVTDAPLDCAIGLHWGET